MRELLDSAIRRLQRARTRAGSYLDALLVAGVVHERDVGRVVFAAWRYAGCW